MKIDINICIIIILIILIYFVIKDLNIRINFMKYYYDTTNPNGVDWYKKI